MWCPPPMLIPIDIDVMLKKKSIVHSLIVREDIDWFIDWPACWQTGLASRVGWQCEIGALVNSSWNIRNCYQSHCRPAQLSSTKSCAAMLIIQTDLKYSTRLHPVPRRGEDMWQHYYIFLLVLVPTLLPNKPKHTGWLRQLLNRLGDQLHWFTLCVWDPSMYSCSAV